METDEADLAAADTSDAAIPDAAVVSIVDAVSHALDTGVQPSGAGGAQGDDQLFHGPPPPPLPSGWVMKESRTQPGYFYYFNYETGITTWLSPVVPEQEQQQQEQQQLTETDDTDQVTVAVISDAVEQAVEASTSKETSKKRLHGGSESVVEETSATPVKKRSKTSSSSGKPSKVRILHILKKHKDSRRPSSWRQPKITATKEEAIEELEGLLDILKEESGEAQRATFEELARTESDCSSAKRGGDLGFFGPKKMQPKFEEASFALQIGELSGIVETSSGVHVLLRIG